MITYVKKLPPRVPKFFLHHGDCLDVLAKTKESWVNSVVCDPPYGLRFMGKDWDDAGDGPAQQEWHRRWAVEAYRVLKPGGYLVAFGGSRTYHRLASAIEDAGFDLRDSIMWLYGSGFPKSLNLPGGFGTALKPAFEPIVLARKPLTVSVAANMDKWGTGALNIDGCRIETTDGEDRARPPRTPNAIFGDGDGTNLTASPHNEVGRWPANVILDEEAGVLLDTQTGMATSRFFYRAKVSQQERNLGCEHLPDRTAEDTVGRDPESAGAKNPRAGAGRGAGATSMVCAKCGLNVDGGRAVQPCANGGDHEPVAGAMRPPSKNHHPTVKPIALMRWLVRLVTPKNGVVLDPFMGSGSTGVASLLEGRDFVGVERDLEYMPLAQARVEAWQRFR